MSDIGFVRGVGGGITVGELKGLDLESAMMAVQTRRSNILEAQLKDQIGAIEGRNKSIQRLNECIAKMNQVLSALPADAKSDYRVGSSGAFNGGDYQVEKEINQILCEQKLKPFQDNGGWSGQGRMLNADGTSTNVVYRGGCGGDTTKAQMEQAVQALKGNIDALNNNQQMDMLKLQSLTNKRNEAFDLMTNFIKKMADSRSSILGNMR